MINVLFYNTKLKPSNKDYSLLMENESFLVPLLTTNFEILRHFVFSSLTRSLSLRLRRSFLTTVDHEEGPELVL